MSVAVMLGRDTVITAPLKPADTNLLPISNLDVGKWNTLSVAIVGGSIAGCCAAIVLEKLGATVTILEKSHDLDQESGAGIVLQQDLVRFLEEFEICKVDTISLKADSRKCVAKDGTVQEVREKLRFCSWGLLFRSLVSSIQRSSYVLGSAVDSISFEGGKSIVKISDGKTLTVDLVVGADGCGSVVRQNFFNCVHEYVGYVGWRGTVKETLLEPDIVHEIRNRFLVFRASNYHMLCYCIPDGSINWVWYENASMDELEEIMLDNRGNRQKFSVSRGRLRDSIASIQKEKARKLFPSLFATLVECTEHIFVQSIHDLIVPDSVVSKDSIVLLGDASCLVRPHTAAGSSKAASDAWRLASCLSSCSSISDGLRQFNTTTLHSNSHLYSLGIHLGNKLQGLSTCSK
eukprot:jgi/Picsp_1/5026/NSC_02389-R1_fad-dependent monooxygenase